MRNRPQETQMNQKIYQQELLEWNRNALHYEFEEKLPFLKIYHQQIFKKKEIPKKYQKILDIGCGVGHFTNHLQQNSGSQIIGVDYAQEMIRVARKRYPKIKFVCAPAEKLPFKDNSFDAIVAVSLLHHLKAQGLLDQGVKEIFRVLKPEGLFCGIDRQDRLLANLLEAFIDRIKNLFKIFKKNQSFSGTAHEMAINKDDIAKITNLGFFLTHQSYLSSLPYKILAVITNFILYAGGQKPAILFQKLTFPLAFFCENRLNFSWFCTDRCLVFKKE